MEERKTEQRSVPKYISCALDGIEKAFAAHKDGKLCIESIQATVNVITESANAIADISHLFCILKKESDSIFTREERSRFPVLANIGTGIYSQTIAQSVKSLAEDILEEVDNIITSLDRMRESSRQFAESMGILEGEKEATA